MYRRIGQPPSARSTPTRTRGIKLRATELRSTHEALAWGKRSARIHGSKQYGWISDAIPQDEIKAEFRRLAKKYDAQA
jgi:hypothetical protein